MNQRTIGELELKVRDVLHSLSDMHEKLDRLLEKADDAKTVTHKLLVENHEGTMFVPTEAGLREIKENACEASPCSTCS